MFDFVSAYICITAIQHKNQNYTQSLRLLSNTLLIRTMARKQSDSIFSRAQELDPNHQVQFTGIPKVPLFGSMVGYYQFYAVIIF